MKIKNKVVVITGASSGIGKELALQLAARGSHCILVARTPDSLKKVQREITQKTGTTPLAIPCDISSEKDISKALKIIKKHYECVDVLINNAGYGKYIVSENMSGGEMRKHFEINFFGHYYCIQAFLPMMKKSRSAYILNVGSLFSNISFADVSVYAASKFALAGFTKGLRKELKQYNINVGLIMPSSVNTPFQAKKEGTRKAPKIMTLEAGRVASEMIGMIEHNRKNRILPRWITPIIKILSLFN